MVFSSNHSLLYSDTLVPDVFITEYMPSLSGDVAKVYIYCLFLGKHNKQASAADIAKMLEMDQATVMESMTCLEGLGVITRSNGGISLVDLKEKEIRKVYRAKSTSTPDEAALSMERSKKRSKFISSINNAFFQGMMSPSWYTDIDGWFDKYQFEEDVMYALFKHCSDYKGLSKKYMEKVAENWYGKNIRNSFDLDKYSMEVQMLKDIRGKIIKKLRKQAYLTEYEEAYVEKWVTVYNYNFEIIELALKRTTSAVNPSFEYINSILTDWHNKGYRTKEEILAAEESRKAANAERKPAEGKPRGRENAAPQKGNFEQRKYDDEYFDKLYKDV